MQVFIIIGLVIGVLAVIISSVPWDFLTWDFLIFAVASGLIGWYFLRILLFFLIGWEHKH